MLTVLLLLVSSSFLASIGNDRDLEVDEVGPGDQPVWQAISGGAGWTSTSSEDTMGFAVGDLNNDGWVDMATAGGSAHPKIYLSNGGQFNAAHSQELAGTWGGASIKMADFDQDGWLDIAIGVIDLHVYLNRWGFFPPVPDFNLTNGRAGWICVGDPNADGWPDIGVAQNTNLNGPGPNQIYFNANGSFNSTPDWYSVESDASWNCHFVDLDQDGYEEMVVANSPSGGAPDRIHDNVAGVVSSTATWNTTESSETRAFAVGDIDRDGWLDLASAGWAQPIRVYLSNSGVLPNSASYSVTIPNTDVILVDLLDVDNDEDLDIVVGRRENMMDTIYRNVDGVLTNQLVWSQTDPSRGRLWGHDMDRDGDQDLVAAMRPGQNRLFYNTGGFYHPTENDSWPVSGGDAVSWGDVDRDGDLDLAVGSIQGAEVHLNNNGVLSSSPVWQGPVEDVLDLAWVDLDDNGYLDLVTASNGPNHVYWNPDGTLDTAAGWTSSQASQSNAVAVGDIDLDGDLDLGFANQGDPVRFYPNDLGSGINTSVFWSSSDRSASSVDFGDMDNDGDLDLALGLSNGGNEVYTSTPSGFVLSWTASESDATSDISWVDFDGDGWLDLISANAGIGQRNRIHFGSSAGLETSASWSSLETNITRSMDLGDINGDGDIDLAFGNWGGDQVYENDLGTPELVWSSSDPGNTEDIAFGDLRGTNVPDLVSLAADGHLTHQLTTTSSRLPGSGATITAPDLPAGIIVGPMDVNFSLHHRDQGALTVNLSYSTHLGGPWNWIDTLTHLSSGDHSFSWNSSEADISAPEALVRIQAFPHHRIQDVSISSPSIILGPVFLDRDSDGDGIGDHEDPFPNETSQQDDRDGDGYGDNPNGTEPDDCPDDWGNSTNDLLGCPDRDGDGTSDQNDPFPDDPTQNSDRDGDGFGDNASGNGPDYCPNAFGTGDNMDPDSNGCPDTDGDGISDNGENSTGTGWDTHDSDGGGLDDGEERDLGLDPNYLCDDAPYEQVSGVFVSTGDNGLEVSWDRSDDPFFSAYRIWVSATAPSDLSDHEPDDVIGIRDENSTRITTYNGGVDLVPGTYFVAVTMLDICGFEDLDTFTTGSATITPETASTSIFAGSPVGIAMLIIALIAAGIFVTSIILKSRTREVNVLPPTKTRPSTPPTPARTPQKDRHLALHKQAKTAEAMPDIFWDDEF